MSEFQKSGIFVAVGLLMLLVGWLVRPSNAITAAKSDSGQPFYPDFESAEVSELEIVAYDKKPLAIKLSRRQGRWEIDTHDRYPTDVEKKLAQAAAAVSHVEKGIIVSETKKDHEKFGVVAPPDKAQPGLEGAGTRVTMKNSKGDTLVSLIVGKEIDIPPAKNADSKASNVKMRYVRRSDQDRVYQCRVDLAKLPTAFSDWIQTDLLQLDAHKIKNVTIDNYSLETQIDPLRGELQVRARFVEKLHLAYDNQSNGTPEKPMWKLDQEVFDPQVGKYKPVKLDAGEELEVSKLNDMRSALDDLKIVDVRRKPEALSRELKVAEKLDQGKAMQDLLEAGYLVLPDGDVKSKDGEIVVGLDDGVEYLLRFGDPVDARGGSKKEDGEKKDGEKKDGEKKDGEKKEDDKEEKKDDKSDDEGKNTRYLLVMARFNQKLLPEPAYLKYPEEKPADKPAEDKPAEDKPAGDKPAAEKPATEKPAETPAKKSDEAAPKKAAEAPKKTDAPKTEAPKAEEKKTEEQKEGGGDGAQAEEPKAKAEEPKADAPKADEPKAEAPKAEAPKADAPKADAPKADAPKADAPKAEAPKAEAPKADAPKADTPQDPAVKVKPEDPVVAQRARIDKQNEILKAEYDKKVADGKKRVEDLNQRFSEWYYVIDDSVFKKIRVERGQIIKAKKAEGQGNTPADFDALKGGLKGIPGLTPPK